MPKPRAEEQFPLLLVLVGEQDVSRDNKRFFGKGRFDGITSGATAIITEWPNYISSCWLTALVCGITLFILSILLTSCMTYQQHPRLPRCSSDYPLTSNKTVHLVHTAHRWYPNQLELLQNITNTYLNHQINLIIISNREPHTNRIIKETNSTKNNQTKSSFTLVNKSDDTIDDLTKKYPNILISRTTYRSVFENSPLFLNWVSLNHQTKVFAIRILLMWQFGGLSYDLLEYNTHGKKKNKNSTNIAELKIESYIHSGQERYEHLNPDTVSIDSSGLHMECKTPCHAFFGNILTRLRRANEKSTPRGILRGPMFTFCRAGFIDKEFCHIQHIILK